MHGWVFTGSGLLPSTCHSCPCWAQVSFNSITPIDLPDCPWAAFQPGCILCMRAWLMACALTFDFSVACSNLSGAAAQRPAA